MAQNGRLDGRPVQVAVLASNPAPPGSFSYRVVRKGPGGQYINKHALIGREKENPQF